MPFKIFIAYYLIFLGISCPSLVEGSSLLDRPLQVHDLGGGWIQAEGEAQVVNITPEEARKRALQYARERAIMHAVGIGVQAQTFLRETEDESGFNDALFSLSQQTSAGKIVEERTPQFDSFEIPSDPLPIMVYRVRVQVKVDREEGQSDPDFQVQVWANKDHFYEGEEMHLGVTATKPCFVTVLNLTAADTVVVLVPHQYRQDRQITPGDTLRIPDVEEKDMGIHYRVVLPAGKRRATEMIKVVATRESFAFGQGLPKVSIYNQVPTRQAALVELQRWLVQIPLDQRAEAQLLYEIREKD